MGNFTYTKAFRKLAIGSYDFVNDDLRALLVMTGTTADTEEDVEFLADFTTLDECDETPNYARQVLGSKVVNDDLPNDRAEFDAANTVFGSLGAATRQNQAGIIYKHVGADSINEPLFYIDQGGFPFDGTGTDVTFQWNAEGIAHFKNAA